MSGDAASGFPTALLHRAEALLVLCRTRSLLIATAESCTGGLVAALITEIAGSSAVFDRGFVTYSNAAKVDLLGVSPELLNERGAVSAETAAAMARGTVERSRASLAVAVTGVAGPGGGTAEKPVGLVHFGLGMRNGNVRVVECRFGPRGRVAIRLAAVEQALALLEDGAAQA